MRQALDPVALDPAVLEEAAEWLIRLSDGELNDHERAQWQRWQTSSPERQLAWQRAQRLQARLGGLPPALALPALDRPANTERRVLIGKLAVLLAVLPAGWASWQVVNSGHWTADYRTAVGERRELSLADGTHINLNTDSAIDVRFDANQRLVRLLAGEMLVHTADDPMPSTRPFLVQTDQGRMQALGTRFIVRVLRTTTRLAVLEGTVRVDLANTDLRSPQWVNAGQSTEFSAQGLGTLTPVQASTSAWTRDMLMADNLQLVDFVAELGRYRQGVLRCDPAIAELRISGAFPVKNIQHTLKMLSQTYPIRVNQHLGGYWITLSAV